MEYEIELTIKRYEESDPYNRLAQPDEVEVFYGRKVFNSGVNNLDDMIDDFKHDASEQVVADSLMMQGLHVPTLAETYYEAGLES